MKIIVTHISPDWDAITSVWLVKRFLSGWQDATVQFVPAGERIGGYKAPSLDFQDAIEKIDGNEVIHVDTGLGPLDHHQTPDTNVCGASRTFDYVKLIMKHAGTKFLSNHEEALSRIVAVVVAIDHFKEVFWADPSSDYHEFSLIGVLEGLKYEKPDQDMLYIEFGMQCLNALVTEFENRIWAEKEIQEKGISFVTRYGKAMGFETINDTVLKLAQKMGYVLVIRKDPRKNYIRIKALPDQNGQKRINLTLAYEQLKKVDPDATWFLHVSKKMLLNGTPKNPKMRPTRLSLSDIIKVLETIYG